MRSFSWNDALCLPDAALAGERRIPKTVLVRQAGLTKTEQKALGRVAALTHFATVQKSTTRIPPTQDEEHDIQSVVFLRCELAGNAAYAEVARLIHKCFPNPTVILFGGEGEACVSVALTRKSLAEQGATVVDRIEATGAFDPRDEKYAGLLDTLAFDALPQTDLLSYLEGLAAAVTLARAVDSLGFYPVCAPQDRERLLALVGEKDELDSAIAELRKQRRDKDISLNDSALLRMEIKRLEKDAANLTNQIKETCHG